MDTPFLVSIKCPECGGPVHYPEGAYTFKCPYCVSVLRVKQEGIDLKYIIPSRLKNKDFLPVIENHLNGNETSFKKTCAIISIKTVYKPFWYFKGMIYYNYSIKGKTDTLGKIWYYSFQANPDFAGMLNSLSIRTEVMTLEPFDVESFKDEGTIILPLLLKKEEAYKNAKCAAYINLQIAAGNASYLYNKLSFIGEQLFIIYYPVIQVVCSKIQGAGNRTFMIDGISKSILAYEEGDRGFASLSNDSDKPYRIKLLAHRCKNCGRDLPAKDFDIVFYCDNCLKLWILKNGDYHCLNIKVIETKKAEDCIFIPFWRFEVTIVSKTTGIELDTISTLSRFMKMGRFLLRMEDPDRPIRLYCPALVTRNAKALLKLASRINLFQRVLPINKTGAFPYKKILNASLLDDEAEEMLEVLIFSIIGRQDRKAIDFYKDFETTVTKKELVWYPFEEKGDFLVDNFNQYNFPKKSIGLNMFSDAEITGKR